MGFDIYKKAIPYHLAINNDIISHWKYLIRVKDAVI